MKGAPHALAPNVARLAPHQLLALQHDGALIRTQLAIDHVEGGGLARAIGANQGQQLARGHVKADAVHRFDAPKGLAQVAHLQQRAHGAVPVEGAALPRQRSHSICAEPEMPWGKSSTNNKMTEPNMARQ